MNYLITGITGFAGPHLANLLIREGHNVFGLVRCSNGREVDICDVVNSDDFQKINFLYGDLCDRQSIRGIIIGQKFDGVFHLAAQSHPPTSFSNPVDTFYANVIGSVHLIDALTELQRDCPLMFCSTSEVYGNSGKDGGVLTELCQLAPNNPYGVSKASIDLYVQERIANGYLHGFITRAFSHTGPRRGKKFSISCDAFQLARMEQGFETSRTLNVGNLDTRRVVIDVRDCVRAYYMLMQKHENGGIYNVGGDEENCYPMRHFTDMLIEISGVKEVQKVIDPKLYRRVDIQVQIPSTNRLRDLTGWTTLYSLEKTLTDLFHYWIHKLN